MAITFSQIPANIRVPLFYAEVSAGAAPYQSTSRLLLIGQKLAGGTAAADTPILVTGSEDTLFGVGSMMARMYKAARLAEPFNEIWCAPLADASGATAATATITVNSAPSVAGTLALYVGGVRVPVAVTAGMTTSAVATAIVAAINGSTMALEATAAAVAAVVTLTAVNKGTVYNQLNVCADANSGDGNLASTILTIVDFAGGAGDPSVANVLANTGHMEFDYIAAPYTDATNLPLIKSYLTTRWGPYEGLFGSYITAKDDTTGNLQTFGLTQNDPNATVYGFYNFMSSLPTIVAVLGSIHCAHLQAPPELSRPLNTLPLPGIVGPKSVADQFSITAQNSLLYSGISTLMIERDGTVAISRAISTYQTNAYGAKDASWLSVNTRAQLQYGLRFLKAYITSIYSRVALVDSNPNNLTGFVTPADIRDALILAYTRLVALGVFENVEAFSQLLIVERDPSDNNRVNVQLNTDAVNQLQIFAVQAVSYLQFADAGV